MRRLAVLALGTLLLAGCSSPAAPRGGGSDPRVLSLMGQTPPEVAPDARWLNAPPTTLAGLRGRVVFVQFAFPT
jgi:hypothetical protein